MSNEIGKLKALSINRETRPGSYADGGNLFLLIGPTGSKSWTLRYTLAGKKREMGLGPLHAVSLLEARSKATKCRNQLAEGIDPISERDAAKAIIVKTLQSQKTFEECALEFMQNKGKDVGQWTPALRDYAYPIIGHLPISEIDAEKVMRVLTPIWWRINVTATRVQNRMENILDYAKYMGYRTGDNPARWDGTLEYALQEPSKVHKVENHPALPYAQVHDFVKELRSLGGPAKFAFEFLILTGARCGEVRKATWDEIDLDKATWTVPQVHMGKSDHVHIVPLTNRAVDILHLMQEFKRKGETHIFPGQKHNIGLSNGAFDTRLKQMQKTRKWTDPKIRDRLITAHGFRSTFSDWATEVGEYSRDDTDACIAHNVKSDTRAAYQRGELLKIRRGIMNKWLEFINKPFVEDLLQPA